MKRLQISRTWQPRMEDHVDWFGCCRLAPDGQSLAFAVREGKISRVVVERLSGEQSQLAIVEEGLAVEDLRWAADGRRFAVMLGEDDSAHCKRICMVCAIEQESMRWEPQVAATSCAWHSDGQRLAVYEAHSQTAVLYGKDRSVERLGGGRDAGEPRFAPQMVFAPGGQKMALSLRSAFDDRVSISVCSWADGGYEQSLLTEIPGHEIHVRPFWSHRGRSLGLLVADEAHEQSGILLFRGAQGEGQVAYHGDVVDVPSQPVWTRDARHVLWFRSEPSEACRAVLSSLEIETGKVQALLEPDALSGDLWFDNGGELIADGDEAVYILRLEP